MHNVREMIEHNRNKLGSAIFITFSGNCKKALTFYQTCFGGLLQFETFEKELAGYKEMPVISGSLVADRIVIYGSDLVQNEGRKLGNYMAIFLHCKNSTERRKLIGKLVPTEINRLVSKDNEERLVEITDAFDVRWMLGI